jgi:hypothetical protein
MKLAIRVIGWLINRSVFPKLLEPRHTNIFIQFGNGNFWQFEKEIFDSFGKRKWLVVLVSILNGLSDWLKWIYVCVSENCEIRDFVVLEKWAFCQDFPL